MRESIIKLASVFMHCITGTHYACRFEPTCSSYVSTAFEKLSFFRAFFLSTFRLLRCNPFNSSWGYDPIPKERKI